MRRSSAFAPRSAMSIARAAQPVGFAAALLGTSCSLSGCLLRFGPSHSEQIQVRDRTTAGPVTESTTAAATTTTLPPHCSNYDIFLENKRPQATVVEQKDREYADETECCSACHASDDCQAFLYYYEQQNCSFVPNKAVWSSPSGEQLFLPADGHIMGFKQAVTCDGCDNCGRDWDEQSWWKDCTICSDPANWDQYPCFLPEGCKCGGDMSPWQPPDPCEPYWNQEEPCTDENWNADCCDSGDDCGDYWNQGGDCSDDNWNPACCGGGGDDWNPGDDDQGGGDDQGGDDPWNPEQALLV